MSLVWSLRTNRQTCGHDIMTCSALMFRLIKCDQIPLGPVNAPRGQVVLQLVHTHVRIRHVTRGPSDPDREVAWASVAYPGSQLHTQRGELRTFLHMGSIEWKLGATECGEQFSCERFSQDIKGAPIGTALVSHQRLWSWRGEVCL